VAGLTRGDILASYAAPPHRIGEEEFARFLERVREGKTLNAAALGTGFSYRSFAHRLERDDMWRERFEEAREEGAQALADQLEDEARRRATEGVQKGVYHKGFLVGTETVYSDRLLERLLERHADGYQRTSRVEVTGQTRHEIAIEGGVTLDAAAEVLIAVGAVPAAVLGATVPAASPVLAEPADGQSTARRLPAAE